MLLWPNLAAAEQTSPDAFATLFRIGEPLGAKAVEEVSAKLIELQGTSPNPRLNFAYGLILIHQLRYERAEEVLSELVPAPEDLLPVSRAKIWTLMMNRKYAAALAEMQSVALTIKTLPETEEAALDREETVEFLGRMIGYLEGPVAGAIKPRALEIERTRLVAAFSPELNAAFQRGVVSLSTEYAKLIVRRDDEQSQARNEAEAQLEKQRAELDKAKEALEKKQDKLETERDSRKLSNKDDISKVDDKGTTVQEKMRALQARAFPLVARLESAQVSANAAIAYAQQSYLDAQNHSVAAAQYRSQGNSDLAQIESQASYNSLQQAQAANYQYQRYAAIASSVAGLLAPLQNEARRLGGEHNALLGEKERLLDKQAEDDERYRAKQEEFDKLDKKLGLQDRQLEGKKPRANSPRIVAINKALKGLTTYEPFPYESERQRLLLP